MRPFGKYLIFLLLLAFMLHAHGSWAQTRRVVRGIVYDSGTGYPCPGVAVKTLTSTKTTDARGLFEIQINRAATIDINHVRFHSRKLEYADYKNQDTLYIYLTPNTTQSANILVSEGAETVYEPDFENVLDFALVRDTLVVLSYMKSKPSVEQQQTVYMQNTLTLLIYGRKIQRITLPDNVQSLYVDPFGRIFVQGSDFVFALKANREQAYLRELSLDYFQSQVEPVTTYYNKNVFYKTYPGLLPEVVHFVLLTEVDSVKPIRMIRNETYFEKHKAAYNSLPPRLKSEADRLARAYQRPSEEFAPLIIANMSRRTYYTPDNAAYTEGDNILIYDHMNSWIFRHDHLGNRKDSVRTYYSLFQDEKLRNTIQDQGTGHCYAVHEKGGVHYIRHINHATGGAGKPFKIKYPYAKNIKIYDGWVYYVYRDLSGEAPYKIVREKIPKGMRAGG